MRKPGVALSGLAAALVLGLPAAAADAITLSGSLSPVVENPNASAQGHGDAVLTIGSDGTQLSWVITYSGVSSQITAVSFCSGNKPRVLPIGVTCAFVIPQADGGPSPITGSRTILAQEAETLSSGYAVIQLASADGPQLYGYIGPPPPNNATVSDATPGTAGGLVAAIGGLAAFMYVLTRWRPRRTLGAVEGWRPRTDSGRQ